ncbi:MAG: efflux RND transporter permease subunit [Holophagales bacterium]|nr:efflux RND transporter permease subunit [Holophagales bacterium]
MEQTVTKLLERRLATTENAILITSESSEGETDVDIHFSYGTDVDIALRDASTKLDQARSALPEEADPPTIGKRDPSQIPVLNFAVSSPTRDEGGSSAGARTSLPASSSPSRGSPRSTWRGASTGRSRSGSTPSASAPTG